MSEWLAADEREVGCLVLLPLLLLPLLLLPLLLLLLVLADRGSARVDKARSRRQVPLTAGAVDGGTRGISK